jgi:hypothetical protein
MENLKTNDDKIFSKNKNTKKINDHKNNNGKK